MFKKRITNNIGNVTQALTRPKHVIIFIHIYQPNRKLLGESSKLPLIYVIMNYT